MAQWPVGICFAFFVLIGHPLTAWKHNPYQKDASGPEDTECEQYRLHFSVLADFLYWQAAVSNLPYGVVARIDTLFGGFQIANHEALKEIQFHRDPGFRVGLAVHFDQEWDLLAKYTRFNTSAHTSKTVTDPGLIFLLWDEALPARTDTLSAHQSLDFSQLNLDFVKHFSFGKHFFLDSFFGAVGAIIDQKLKIKANQLFDPPSIGVVKTDIKNRFSGGGLEVGLQTSYAPIKWFSFYGKGSYALLYGKFKLATHSTDTVNIPPEVSFTHDQATREFAFVNAFDILAGLKFLWALSYCELAFHIDYEFVFWPNQVRVPRIHADVTSKTPLIALNNNQGDVGFHGLTAGLTFRF